MQPGGAVEDALGLDQHGARIGLVLSAAATPGHRGDDGDGSHEADGMTRRKDDASSVAGRSGLSPSIGTLARILPSPWPRTWLDA
jgi:hypothetical protein